MKIAIIGAGRVGLTIGIGLAKKGHRVTFLDVDKNKVKQINEGKLPFHEMNLREVFKLVFNGIKATTEPVRALEGKEINFITVPTPTKEDKINLRYVKEAAGKLGKNLKLMNKPLVVLKSTVLPGTTEEVLIPILEKKSGLKVGRDFGIAMNPEFLREGNALHDFLHPDRIVIGSYNKESCEKLAKIYKYFKAPIFETGLKEAEMIKYASNALLATKISFANEIGNICKELGIDTYEVMDAVGMDSRINRKFLDSGVGFGGSCLPKDVKALINKAKELGKRPKLLEQVLKRNENQRKKMIDLTEQRYGKIDGKNVGILGLAFKPGTDDIREAPSLTVIDNLIQKGCTIYAHDPKANEKVKEIFPEVVFNNTSEVIENSDIIMLLTEWPQFKKFRKELEKSGKPVIEGRRFFYKLKNVEGICW